MKTGQKAEISPCSSLSYLCCGKGTWFWLRSLSSPLPGSTPGTYLCIPGRLGVWSSSTPLTTDAGLRRSKPSRPCAVWTTLCGRWKPPLWPIWSCTWVTARATGPTAAWTWGFSSVSPSWSATWSKERCTVTSSLPLTCSTACRRTRWIRWASCFTVLCQSRKFCSCNGSDPGFDLFGNLLLSQTSKEKMFSCSPPLLMKGWADRTWGGLDTGGSWRKTPT